VTPPIWLDDQGRRQLTRPCPRCGREAPVYRFRLEHLRLMGWRLFTVASYTNWCGHGQEFIPVPDDDGWCCMVPVLGEAT
jgi:hypothetical protein